MISTGLHFTKKYVIQGYSLALGATCSRRSRMTFSTSQFDAAMSVSSRTCEHRRIHCCQAKPPSLAARARLVNLSSSCPISELQRARRDRSFCHWENLLREAGGWLRFTEIRKNLFVTLRARFLSKMHTPPIWKRNVSQSVRTFSWLPSKIPAYSVHNRSEIVLTAVWSGFLLKHLPFLCKHWKTRSFFRRCRLIWTAPSDAE